MPESDDIGTQEDPQQGLPEMENPKKGLVPLTTVQKFFRNPWTGEVPTERAIQLWAEKGYFPKGDHRGLYPLLLVTGGVYWAFLEIINKKKGPEGEALIEWELREQRAKAEEREIRVHRMRGDLVPINEITQEWGKILLTFKTKSRNLKKTIIDELVNLFLSGISSYLREALPGDVKMGLKIKLEETIGAQIDEMLTELSAYDPDAHRADESARALAEGPKEELTDAHS